MKRIELSSDEIHLLLRALSIASEDGSIYGTAQPNTPQWTEKNTTIERLEIKLRNFFKSK